MTTGFSDAYFAKLTNCLAAIDRGEVDRAVDLVITAWRQGRQIITFGNGGSAMTSLHFMTDWSKSISMATGKPFRGRSLIDNIGLITAYANDLSYEDIFAQQIRNIAQPGDLVIAISGSGNSENVIRAVQEAERIGCVTLGLCGFSGGRLKELARHVVWVRVHDMQLTEDVHAIFGHIVMKRLCYPEAIMPGLTIPSAQ